MINIAVKMIDSRHDKYPHLPQLFSSRAPALFQPSMCLISSLTVLLYDSSYNLGDDLGSLPYTHNQSFRGTDREEGSVWGVVDINIFTLIQLVVLPQLCRQGPQLSITILLWSDINISKDQPSLVDRKYLLNNPIQPSYLLRALFIMLESEIRNYFLPPLKAELYKKRPNQPPHVIIIIVLNNFLPPMMSKIRADMYF